MAEFRPSYVYPYHYRGRDGGTQDPAEFAALVGDKAAVKFGGWYGQRHPREFPGTLATPCNSAARFFSDFPLGQVLPD